MNLLHFFHLQHPVEPLTDELVLIEVFFVDNIVSDLEKILQVSNGKCLSSHKAGLSELKLFLELAHSIVHLFFCSLKVHSVDGLLLLDAFIVFEENQPEESRSKTVLVPRQMLIDHTALLQTQSIILAQFLGIFLAEIDEDSIAFSKFEVSICDEGNLAKRIHLHILLSSCLVVDHVHYYWFMGYFSDVQKALDCSGRLTAYVPIEGEAHYDISIIIHEQHIKSQFAILFDWQLLEHLDHAWNYYFPLLSDCFHFFNLEHSAIPGFDEGKLVQSQFVENKIGGFEEVYEVSYCWSVASQIKSL